eukprot:8225664-Karenia_brevis.AAC.1
MQRSFVFAIVDGRRRRTKVKFLSIDDFRGCMISLTLRLTSHNHIAYEVGIDTFILVGMICGPGARSKDSQSSHTFKKRRRQMSPSHDCLTES